jgi:RecB family exonuclease
MEGRRWMGDNDANPGLLTQWLFLELQRLNEGWHWLGEESRFDALTVPGFPFALVGRIDRIDNHDDKGVMLWDYKSGDHPTSQAVVEHLIDPQIPAYVKAAREHRITQTGQEIGPNQPVSGGYIALKRVSSVSHKEVKPKQGNWDIVLQQWQESVVRLGEMLISGQFQAMPYPVSEGVRQEKACLYCHYRPLCGRKESIS